MTPAQIETQDILDTISDAIGDSMDMDWTYSDGARSIMRAFEREGWSVIQNSASNTAGDASRYISDGQPSAPMEAVAWQARARGTEEWFTVHRAHEAFFRGSDQYEVQALAVIPTQGGGT